MLDLSKNFLAKIDLTPLKGDHLFTLNLEKNDLTEFTDSTRNHFKTLRKLLISQNQISCEFVKIFVTEHEEFKYVNIVSDVWDQHAQDCIDENQQTTELIAPTVKSPPKVNQFFSTTERVTTEIQVFDPTGTPHAKSVTNQDSAPWTYIAVVVSVLSVVIIVILCVIFRKKFFDRISSHYYCENRTSLARENGYIHMSPIPKPLPEIPVSFHASPDDNPYEEIQTHTDNYDHLDFSENPKPVSTFHR